MHRPDLIEQFGRERQSQLLKEAQNLTHMSQARQAVPTRQTKQALSLVTRLYAILRRQSAPSI